MFNLSWLFGRKTKKPQRLISKDGRVIVGAFFPDDSLSIDECENRGLFKSAAVKAFEVGDAERAARLFERGGYFFLASRAYWNAGLRERAKAMYQRAVQQHKSEGWGIPPLDS